MDISRVRRIDWLTARSTLDFWHKTVASEISGISRVDSAESKDDGKNKSGIAIPLSIPNSDSARSREFENLARQFGTSRFSMVRSEVLRYRDAVIGTAILKSRRSIRGLVGAALDGTVGSFLWLLK